MIVCLSRLAQDAPFHPRNAFYQHERTDEPNFDMRREVLQSDLVFVAFSNLCVFSFPKHNMRKATIDKYSTIASGSSFHTIQATISIK
mmetsp:Transcript_6971/g.10585  ORF Transcript_6971/g.10585 Transcript_6971/m.10585 type:complete len:88 (-) Transcript_6971:594-857(-)